MPRGDRTSHLISNGGPDHASAGRAPPRSSAQAWSPPPIHERHVPGDVEAEDAFTRGLEDEFVLAAGAFQGLLRPLHFRDMLLNRRRHLVKGAGQLSQLTRPPRPPRPRVA